MQTVVKYRFWFSFIVDTMLKTLRGIKLLFFVVTAIKFAHDDKYLLACSSTDGTLSVCALVPSPPSVSCTLRGHTAAVTGR